MRRLLILLVLLAGCQPLPHPFADAKDAPHPALRPPDVAGVVVEPIAGAPQAADDALAAALRDNDVPAETGGGNRGSYRLQSKADTGAQGLTLGWTLLSPKGATVGQGTETAAGADWAALAKAAAPKIAALVAGDAPEADADVPTAVQVRGIEGAPGDGGTSLARAIGAALGHAGLAVGEHEARFQLSCKVAVAPPEGGQQLVTVRWILARPAGKEVGEVNQQNKVPAGSLDGAWGDVAYAVADAAAPGIAQLIEKAEE
jgi:hypothetical protein